MFLLEEEGFPAEQEDHRGITMRQMIKRFLLLSKRGGSKLVELKFSYEVIFAPSNQWWAGHEEQLLFHTAKTKIERFNAIILLPVGNPNFSAESRPDTSSHYVQF